MFISFVDFGVPLNYYFGLRTFPVSAAQIVANGGKMGGIEERCDDPSKPPEFLGSAEERKSGNMLGLDLVLGDGKKRQGQVYFTR